MFLSKKFTVVYPTTVKQMFDFMYGQEIIETERIITCLKMSHDDIDLFYKFLKFLKNQKIVIEKNKIIYFNKNKIDNIIKLKNSDKLIKYLG